MGFSHRGSVTSDLSAAGQHHPEELPMAIGAGLGEEVLDVRAGGIDSDLQRLGSLFDALSAKKTQGHPCLGRGEGVEAA